MPRIKLRQPFADRPPVPAENPKTDYYDTLLSGFVLEVRRNGRATYYLRYRDKTGRQRQTRLGDTTTLSVEGARERARALKSKVLMGFEPGRVIPSNATPGLRFVHSNRIARNKLRCGIPLTEYV
jgi:hypothetical protein